MLSDACAAWARDNDMAFAPDKSKAMVLEATSAAQARRLHAAAEQQATLGGQLCECVAKFKYLGVWLAQSPLLAGGAALLKQRDEARIARARKVNEAAFLVAPRHGVLMRVGVCILC